LNAEEVYEVLCRVMDSVVLPAPNA
jgi:hypothetical protein